MGAQGTTTLNFGAFPGASDAAVAVTGQSGILSGSLVEAWLQPATTADHTHDEHLLETITVRAGNIIAGTGFTIYGINNSQINENAVDQYQSAMGDVNTFAGASQVGRGTRIYGAWNVAWVWN